MHESAAHAEAELDALASHLEVWRPGGYAGHLFAAFATAQRRVALVNAADRPFYAERLQRIAARAGILLAPSCAPTAPIATIKVAAKLREIEAELSDVEPGVAVHEEVPGAFAVRCDHVAPLTSAPAWLLAQIDASLRLFRYLGVFENYVLTPTV